MTRAALMDAALECLVERGYSGTTTIETARRAGVSRGAQLHHFPTKAALLAAVVEHLFERRLAEFRAAFAALDPSIDPLDGAIDLLWSMFEGPTFIAWAELWMAARTDPELAETVVAVDRRFSAASQALFLEIFPPRPDVDPRIYEIGRDFAFSVMSGVALGRLVGDGWRPPAEYLTALKLINRAMGATS